MDRFRKTVWFWAIVLIAAMFTASSEARSKRLYRAPLIKGNTQIGSAVITEHPTGYDFMARTFGAPNQVVTKVSLVPQGGGWEVTLCENGGPAGDCSYDASGNLDISGAITPTMLFVGGATGGSFSTNLRNGNLYILLNGGSEGSGIFVRII